MATFSEIIAAFNRPKEGRAGFWNADCPACNGKRKVWILEKPDCAIIGCHNKDYSGNPTCVADSILYAIGKDRKFLIYPATYGSEEWRHDQRRNSRAVRQVARKAISTEIPSCTIVQNDEQDRRLFPAHYKELSEGSGISDEVIDNWGAWTESDPAVLVRECGFPEWQAELIVPCLVMPAETIDGGLVYQVKPDKPRLGKDKKEIKYETPAGSETRLCFLPGYRDIALDPSKPRIFTEGMKKIAAAASKGYGGVSIAGVWNFQNTDKITREHILKPDAIAFFTLGGTLDLCFDSDALSKGNVYDALRILRAAVFEHGATPKIVQLDDDGAAKVGLDDFIVAGGDVDALLSSASDDLPQLVTPHTRCAVETIQKRAKNGATIHAKGATFRKTATMEDVRSVSWAAQKTDREAEEVAGWVLGDSYVHLEALCEHGELGKMAKLLFGHKAGTARNAARACRAFPTPESRRATLAICMELAAADVTEETRDAVFTAHEHRKMSVKQAREIVRVSKGLPARSEVPARSPQDDPNGFLKRDRALVDLFPADMRDDAIAYLRDCGTDPLQDLIERWKRDKVARAAQQIYEAHCGTADSPEEPKLHDVVQFEQESSSEEGEVLPPNCTTCIIDSPNIEERQAFSAEGADMAAEAAMSVSEDESLLLSTSPPDEDSAEAWQDKPEPIRLAPDPQDVPLRIIASEHVPRDGVLWDADPLGKYASLFVNDLAEYGLLYVGISSQFDVPLTDVPMVINELEQAGRIHKTSGPTGRICYQWTGALAGVKV